MLRFQSFIQFIFIDSLHARVELEPFPGVIVTAGLHQSQVQEQQQTQTNNNHFIL